MSISVVLTSFNYARYLPQSLGAILAQTRPADELIIIDDGSGDGSVELIEAMIADRPEARLIRNTVNVGCVTNMNRGMAQARGEMILFAAADDELHPDFLRECADLLARHPQAALCSTASLIMDETGRRFPPLPAPVPLTRPGFIPPARVARLLMREDGWFMGNATLFRRACLLDEGGFLPELESYADGYASRLLALRHGACHHPVPLAVWRRTDRGMAWRESVDNGKENRRINLVCESMKSSRYFPAKYPGRWRSRTEFGIYRFNIECGLRKEEGERKKYFNVIRKTLKRVMIAGLFVRKRWFDLCSMPIRYIRYWVR
jgi:Glycosyltransferases involved in cell wall biogenesis